MAEKLVAMSEGFHNLLDPGRTDYAYPNLGIVTRSYLRSEGETLRSFTKAYNSKNLQLYSLASQCGIASLGTIASAIGGILGLGQPIVMGEYRVRIAAVPTAVWSS